MAKNGGSLGESGCVNWMFEKKGSIIVPHDVSEDIILEILLGKALAITDIDPEPPDKIIGKVNWSSPQIT